MKKYESPKFEIYMFSEDDILTMSGDNLANDDDFEPFLDNEFLPLF